MNALQKLPNIGKTLAEQLRGAGIDTPGLLAEPGSRESWLWLRRMDPSACFSRLCALRGAIRAVRWHDLPEDTNGEPRAYFRSV